MYDISGNGNHGTLTGMDPATCWQPGPDGAALGFDGSDDHVRIGSWGGYSRFSIVASVRLDRAIGSIEQIIAADDSNTPGPIERCFQFRRDASGTLSFIVFVGGVVKIITSAATLTSGQWWNIAATTDGNNGAIYIWGASAKTGATGLVDSLFPHCVIGARDIRGDYSQIGDPLRGQIANLALYFRALSADEVAWLAAEPYAGVRGPGPRYWWLGAGVLRPPGARRSRIARYGPKLLPTGVI